MPPCHRDGNQVLCESVVACMRDVEGLHEHFQRELVRGHALQGLVGMRLINAGLWARVPLLRVAPEFADRKQYGDSGDVFTRRGDASIRLEVKSTRFAFSEGGADFPFARPFVMTESAWRTQRFKPAAIVLVSQETGSMAVIPGSSAPSWTVRQTEDTRRGYTDRFLTVARTEMRPFEELAQWLTVSPSACR